MEAIGKEALAEKYADAAFQEKLFRLTSMSEILGACLVAKNYRPSQELCEAIKLTPYGESKLQQFIRKKVPVLEARLSCFLEFSWIDLLVDVESTDDRVLQTAISKQVQSREIYFPFIFGRELYDRAYEQLDLPDGATELSLHQTLEFLDDTSQGVFQTHSMVTGPFGLLTSEQLRFYEPDRSAKLMHCSDVTCDEVHSVRFSTALDALINKHRPETVRILKRDSETPSSWGSFLADIFTRVMKPARDDAGDALIPLIGDSLTQAELQIATAWLLDNTKGRLREVAAALKLRGRSEDIVDRLGRAELMQLCLTLSDRDVIHALDTLVHEERIRVPEGEFRSPVINSSVFGRFRIAAELGSHGVRLFSHKTNVAPLRLRQLIENMYRLDDPGDREELEWQLRGEDAGSLEARLDQYLQNNSPRKVLSSLVLARKSNAITACEVLSLREGASESEDFLSLMLWKLGYPLAIGADPHEKFWTLHEEMEKIVRSVPGSPLGPSVDVYRRAAGAYFPELEKILDESLCFTVWALTNDHFVSKRPYTYAAVNERDASDGWLASAAAQSSESRLEFGPKATLYSLCRGFQCIASGLINISNNRDTYRRSPEEIPDWASQQGLQRFPFLHTVPYLDLIDEAQLSIVQRLKEISRGLVADEAPNARNDWLHSRRDPAEFDKVKAGLRAIRAAVQSIEDAGFSCIPYAVSSVSIDAYGHRRTEMLSTRGFSFSTVSPSVYDWLNLPGVGDGVYIMNSAVFSAPNHALRFRPELPSPYTDIWSDYPKRKPRSQRAIKSVEKLPVPEE